MPGWAQLADLATRGRVRDARVEAQRVTER